MASPLKIGLTGGIAAGKSEALKAFARLGAATLSSDAVVHELLEGEPLRGRLEERWGPEVVADGQVNRAKIGEIVFADPEQLTWLEAQIHPLVQKQTTDWLLSLPQDTEVAVVEIP
ncbi:MAG TPA: dephospho-CoA kinase, partial [Solirubrobacterales bacterium]